MNPDLLALLKIGTAGGETLSNHEDIFEESEFVETEEKITCEIDFDNLDHFDSLYNFSSSQNDLKMNSIQHKKTKKPVKKKQSKKLHPCDQCEKTFLKADRLKAHIVLNHLKQSLRCETCTAAFRNFENFQVSHHL